VTEPMDPTLDALVDRVLALRARVGGGRPVLVGVVGEPGAGKSTLTASLVAALRENGTTAVLVPMDGFHLANAELLRLGRRERKGAVDTFDAAGYAALLRRLRDPAEEIVYAPHFAREIEEPIACSLPVPSAVPLVVTEGNYLLVDDGPWAAVRALLDEVWYLEVPEDVRLERLVARHIEFGKDPDTAWAWSHGTDQRNADVIAATKARADRVVRL